MSAGNYVNSPAQGAQGGQHQAHYSQQQPVTRNNLGRLPFTSNVDNYQYQDSSYERRILGQPATHSSRENAARSIQGFNAHFQGGYSANGSQR